jgi:hypothetical protein
VVRGGVQSCLIVTSRCLWYAACMSGRRLVMTRLVVAVVGQQRQVGSSASQGWTVQSWSTAPPRRVDRLLRLAGLLGGELVGRSASQGCSVGSWSTNGPEDDCGLTFVYPILRYPTLSVDRPKRQLGPTSRPSFLMLC